MRRNVIARLAGGLDMVIDFATLGEYGLQPTAFDAGCEGSGQTTGWEAPASARRGRCEPAAPLTTSATV